MEWIKGVENEYVNSLEGKIRLNQIGFSNIRIFDHDRKSGDTMRNKNVGSGIEETTVQVEGGIQRDTKHKKYG